MRAQQRQRLIVLGIGGGQMDAILIQAASNQFDSFVAAAMPIVTTFHFQ